MRNAAPPHWRLCERDLTLSSHKASVMYNHVIEVTPVYGKTKTTLRPTDTAISVADARVHVTADDAYTSLSVDEG